MRSNTLFEITTFIALAPIIGVGFVVGILWIALEFGVDFAWAALARVFGVDVEDGTNG